MGQKARERQKFGNLRSLWVRKTNIFLHATTDSNLVYRISTKYAGLPRVKMIVTDKDGKTGKKVKMEVSTTGSQKCFRSKMGFNDQSDAKRARIGLSAKYFKQWPQHLLGKTIEDCIINSYGNYLLDPNCPTETWPDFLYSFVQELLDSGENMRKKQEHDNEFKISHARGMKRILPGSDSALLIGANCLGGNRLEQQRELPAKKRTRVCAFCGRRDAKFKCRSCLMHLCVT